MYLSSISALFTLVEVISLQFKITKAYTEYMSTSEAVDVYIETFDGEVKARLVEMRQLVRAEATGAEESIAYGMPAYKLNGRPVVYFAGYAKHIGFYATPNGHEAFAKEFAKYKQGKGSVQFPLSQPLPVELVRRVVRFRTGQTSGAIKSDELPYISKPALRALAAIDVTRTIQLRDYAEKDLLALHGFGPKAIRQLKEAGVKLKEKE